MPVRPCCCTCKACSQQPWVYSHTNMVGNTESLHKQIVVLRQVTIHRANRILLVVRKACHQRIANPRDSQSGASTRSRSERTHADDGTWNHSTGAHPGFHIALHG